MSYVDGFVIPVSKRKIGAYKKMARLGRKAWLEAGALEYFECAGDDLKAMPGAGDFKRLAKVRAGETVFFSFIVYKNKAHRNAVNKKVMAAMPKDMSPKDMPFDMKRMAFGGFKVLVEGRSR
jgi:alkaline phosphatase